MITGYNTDVPYQKVVLHVQTEDKGLATAWIESLVYVGGQILGRKRSSYKSLLDRGGGKQEIVDLMDRQHRLVIAEIRKGRFDAQLAAVAGPEALREAVAVAAEVPEAVLDAAPEEAGPSLDEVILEYLNTEAEQEHLVLMMDADREISQGQQVTLEMLARSSVSGEPVEKASITVKMISTVDQPATLGRAETDGDGKAKLPISIPRLRQGTAALIITASSPIGGAEIKHLL